MWNHTLYWRWPHLIQFLTHRQFNSFKNSSSQIVVPRSSAAALASSRNLLEHRISGLSPDLLNKNLHLNKSLRPLFLVAQMVKNPPTTCENWVRSLGWEDALEEGTTTHSYSRLENPHGQRSLVGYNPWGHKELDTERLSTHRLLKCTTGTFPGAPVLRVRLSMQRVQVRSLVGDLRSHRLRSQKHQNRNNAVTNSIKTKKKRKSILKKS